MTPRQDPYRVLGLVPGATPGEIRSAYRRLAKLYHPDAAGDRAVARFLAIQAAYEELLDADGRFRVRGWQGRGGGASPPTSSSTSRASRDAWRARQASGAGPATGSTRRASGPSAETEAGAGADEPRQRRSNGTRPGDASAGPGEPGARRGAGSKRAGGPGARPERRTARPGSTTYDEASQPLDPAWDGGAWYGATSGSYWTLNPREYADPRKHGPEYQERARRAARMEAIKRARAAGGSRADAPAPPAAPTSDFDPEPVPPAAETGSPPDRLRRVVRRPGRPSAP